MGAIADGQRQSAARATIVSNSGLEDEEGMSGRVYDVCEPCRRRYDKQVEADLAQYDDWNDYD